MILRECPFFNLRFLSQIALCGLLALFADITTRKRAEIERASQTEYLQQLVDQIPAFLWVIDRDLIVRRIEGGRPMLRALDRDRLIGLSQRHRSTSG